MLPKWSRLALRVGPWLALWAIAALVLVNVWPVCPRLNVKYDVNTQVLGFTPDSRDLLLATRRVDNDMSLHSSGPLQLLSLQTGTVRQIELPHQPPCVELVDRHGESFFKLDEPWHIDMPSVPIHGRWFRCAWSKEETTAARTTMNLLVNLDTGQTIEAPPQTEFDLSRTGRYLLENHSPTSTSRQLRVRETESGRELFNFDVAATGNGWAFSPDERHFAYAAIGKEEQDPENRLWVWQIEPKKLRHLIEGFWGEPVFSPDGSRLAVILVRDSNKSIVVFDVMTGDRVWEQSLGRGFIDHDSGYGPRLDFSRDGAWIITSRNETRYRPLSSFGRTYSQQIILDAWQLETGTHVTFPEDQWDPRIRMLPTVEPALPPVLLDEHTPQTVPEGRALAPLQRSEFVSDVTADGRSLLVCHFEPHAWSWLLFHSKWRRWLPNILQELLQSKAICLLKDAATGTVQAVLPESCATHWHRLSPDHRTLVVWGQNTPMQFSIYDFPPQPSRIEPLGWALLAPLMVYGLRWWWRWRRRSHGSPPSLTGGSMWS